MMDSLQLQVTSALQRLAGLQRRLDAQPERSKLAAQLLQELETAIEELRVSHEHILEQRDELDRLRAELQREREKYWQLFDMAPEAYLVTRADTNILEANRAAAELLNMSQRFLTGKPLSIFVCSDRSRFLQQAGRLAEGGGSADWQFRVRPRERAPLDVQARVVATAEGQGSSIRWILRPAGGQAGAALGADN